MPEEPKDKTPKGAGEKDAKPKGGGGGKDTINRKRMAADYGFALAFMNSDPELKKLFNQAVKQTWTSEMFVAKLRASKWFEQNSASVRNAIMQETSDPATYGSNVDQMYATVRDTYGSLFGAEGLDDKQLRAWAETAHRMGWSEAQLVDRIVKGVDFEKTLRSNALGGQAAEVKGQIDQLVSAYGVNLGDNWKANQVSKIMEGGDTAEGVRQRVQELAMREYSAFADRIQAGETVMDIADPYMQKMADMLELNPYDVDLKNDLIQKAMKQQSPDGKPAAMDLYTFEKEVRADNRWQYTANARKEVSGLTESILRSFGLTA